MNKFDCIEITGVKSPTNENEFKYFNDIKANGQITSRQDKHFFQIDSTNEAPKPIEENQIPDFDDSESCFLSYDLNRIKEIDIEDQEVSDSETKDIDIIIT